MPIVEKESLRARAAHLRLMARAENDESVASLCRALAEAFDRAAALQENRAPPPTPRH